MSLLGNVGNLYLRILILLLIIGLGSAGYWTTQYLYAFFGFKKIDAAIGKTDWMKLVVLSIASIILLLILQNILTPARGNSFLPATNMTPTANQPFPAYQQSLNGWLQNATPATGGANSAANSTHASHHPAR